MAISAVEIKQWINKQQPIINSSRITQIYRYNKKEIVLSLNTKEGKKFLTMQAPNTIFLSETKPEGEHKDTGFGRWLRNNLKGHIIDTIEQVRSERIITISTKYYNIYIELFGKGNITLCDKDNIILISIEKQELKDRTISKGETYVLPESFDAFNSTKTEFQNLIEEFKVEGTINNSKFLATKIGLGGKVAKEICTSLNLNEEDSITKINPEELKEKITELTKQNIEEEKLKENYKKEIIISQSQNEIKKIQSIIDAQTKSKKEVIKNSEEYAKMGEYIYNNYQFFDELTKLYASNTISEEKVEELKKQFNIQEKVSYKKPKITININ